eukprot:1276972-Amphidinium_carterae.1
MVIETTSSARRRARLKRVAISESRKKTEGLKRWLQELGFWTHGVGHNMSVAETYKGGTDVDTVLEEVSLEDQIHHAQSLAWDRL